MTISSNTLELICLAGIGGIFLAMTCFRQPGVSSNDLTDSITASKKLTNTGKIILWASLFTGTAAWLTLLSTN